ncbi:MAG TPA: TRAP transporter small permease subunit, partial [Lacunisphaera sp.]|nr:TRAP transporter small permease subunit [Lacunisphaera sp.]
MQAGDFATALARANRARQHLAERTNAALDRLGALLFAAALGLMAWRTTIGGLNAWSSQSATMMLGLPEWIVYVFMVPPLVLCAVIGLA